MSKIVILSLEDEPEVRDAIERDLASFEQVFQIEVAEDVKDAEDVIASVTAAGNRIGLSSAITVCPASLGSIS